MVFALSSQRNAEVDAVQLICRKWPPNKVNVKKSSSSALFSNKRNPSFISIRSSVHIGWDKIETIDSLLRKGGYRGHITPDVRESIKLTRYQSSETHLPYDEYRELADRRQGKCNGAC